MTMAIVRDDGDICIELVKKSKEMDISLIVFIASSPEAIFVVFGEFC